MPPGTVLCAARLALEDASGPARADPTAGGLVLSIAGVFLLACALLAGDPGEIVRRRFGERPEALRSLRESLFQRVQLLIGFVLLLAGLALELAGHLASQPQGHGAATTLWIGAAVVLTALFELGGWWWSARSFRRHVAQWLREHPQALGADAALVREIGELFGVEPRGDDTIQAYVARVRQRAGLPPEGRGAAAEAALVHAPPAEDEPGEEGAS